MLATALRVRRSLGGGSLFRERLPTLVVLMLFGLILSLAVLRFETNDDVTMQLIASGVLGGRPDHHLIMTNVVLGYALTALYVRLPGVDWYSLYILGSHLAAMLGLVWALFARTRNRPAIAAFLLLFVAFELVLVLRLQYTSTAMTAAGSGFLCILAGASVTPRRPALVAMGVVLVVLGAMIRWMAFALALGALAPLILAESVCQRNWRPLVWAALAAVASLGLIAFDFWDYARLSEWNAYREHLALRIAIEKTGLQSRLNHPENVPELAGALERAGWSTTDAKMFAAWCFAHPAIYSTEKLRLIASAATGSPTLRDCARRTVRAARDMRHWVAMTALNAAVFLVTCLRSDWRRMLGPGCVAILAGGAWVYLAGWWRLPARVGIPLLFVLNMAMTYSWLGVASLGDLARRPTVRWAIARHASWLALGSAVVAYLVLLCLQGRYLLGVARENQRCAAAFEKFIDVLRDKAAPSTRPTLLVLWGGAFPCEWAPCFFDWGELDDFRLLPFGWETFSPVYQRTLASAAIADIYQAAYQRDDVWIVASQERVQLLRQFIAEHYGQTAYSTEIARVPSLTGSQSVVCSLAAEKRDTHDPQQSYLARPRRHENPLQ